MSQDNEKDLDAVKMMREIRDGLSRKLMQMTHEEQRRYIQEQLAIDISDHKEQPHRRSTA